MIISLLLSTSIIGAIGNSIAQDLTDNMDTTLKGEYVNYQGQSFTFQHQLWRIQNQSVCANLEKFSPAYNKCTVTASQYFSEICQRLSNSNKTGNNIPQIRSMICAASVSFKPVIAEVSKPKIKSDLEKLEQECNVLIIQASSSDDESVAHKRDKVCAKYNAAQ